MRVVLTPDSFKESLSARAVCAALAEGIRSARPDAEIVWVPLSDGGEGLVDVLVTAGGGATVLIDVEDPLGRPVRAPLAVLDGGRTIALEVAHAVGLGLLAPGERDPLVASSYGAGLLLRAAIARRPDTVLVGLGGSATVDGGGGLAQALGVRFRDAAGAPVPADDEVRFAGRHLERVHTVAWDWHRPAASDAARSAGDRAGPYNDGRPRSGETSPRVEALCDVTTPLVDVAGRLGAARRYGPQKGATPATVERLARGLDVYAAAIARSGGATVAAAEGAGAAGGLGAALLAFCGAPLVSGFDRVAGRVGLARAIASADLVITGEGRLDEQTAEGKVVAGVVRLAAAAGVPVVAVVGDCLLAPVDAAARQGLSAVYSLTQRAGSKEAALRNTGPLLRETGVDVMRSLP